MCRPPRSKAEEDEIIDKLAVTVDAIMEGRHDEAARILEETSTVPRVAAHRGDRGGERRGRLRLSLRRKSPFEGLLCILLPVLFGLVDVDKRQFF